MTPKYHLRIGIIEREGEAPIVVARLSAHVTPMKPPRGRPKATAKHAAVVMAFGLELLRRDGKRLTAGEAVARRFGYSGERKVRRIIKARQNPLRGAKENWFIFIGVNGSGDLVIAPEHPDAVAVTETTIRIDGRGWIWKSGEAEAGYGQLRGAAECRRAETRPKNTP
ncbi:MAG: hypothetical protein ACREXX_05080 [Gammaproteobacteria bacterium]